MLTPVTENAINLALIETIDNATPKGSPDVLHLTRYLAQENVKQVVRILNSLGFVVAKDAGDPLVNDIGEVITIFTAGRAHAPGRMSALEDAWPALHEALSSLADNLQHEEPQDGR